MFYSYCYRHTHFNAYCLIRVLRKINTGMLDNITLQKICCILVFCILFVRVEVVCLILLHFNRYLTCVIMWCVEGHCDMHQ
jgi:hypothetical protein